MRRVREGALRSHRAPGAQLKLKRSLGRLCRTRRRRRRGERGRERNFFFFWNRERWRGGAESLQVPRSSPAHWLFSSFVRDRADWSQMALSKLRWGVPCSAAHDAATPPSHNLFFAPFFGASSTPSQNEKTPNLKKDKFQHFSNLQKNILRLRTRQAENTCTRPAGHAISPAGESGKVRRVI